VALLTYYGVAPGPGLLLLPVWLSLILALALGLGLMGAALTVSYRDVQYVLPVLIPFLLYATPVAYSVSDVPAAYRTAFSLMNPLVGVIEGFRWSVLGTTAPPWTFVLYSASVAVLALFAGAAMFRRMERRFADVI
jgi:lipopolysaccharide transport system permease protein